MELFSIRIDVFMLLSDYGSARELAQLATKMALTLALSTVLAQREVSAKKIVCVSNIKN